APDRRRIYLLAARLSEILRSLRRPWRQYPAAGFDDGRRRCTGNVRRGADHTGPLHQASRVSSERADGRGVFPGPFADEFLAPDQRGRNHGSLLLYLFVVLRRWGRPRQSGPGFRVEALSGPL